MGEPARQQATTDRTELDRALERLRKSALDYARSTVVERIALARQLSAGYHAIADESVAAGCRAKGISLDEAAAAEEWASGPMIVIRNLRLLVETMSRIADGRPVVDPARIRTRADGRVIVDVFPASPLDSILFGGFRGEVWMEEGIKAAEVSKLAAAHYRTPTDARKGRVVLVLGAGNVASIPPTDVIYKLFVEGKVCLLKMNPVNAYLGPFIERAFRPAIERGLLAVCYGGADVGAYLAEHASVDEIHITGSDKTHDQMVWGPPGPDRESRKAAGTPLLTKEITSELGNVSPVIVVPGPYSDGDFAAQAISLGAAITTNASFNCNAAKLLLQPRGWPGAAKLRSALTRTLEATPLRKAYYPGAEERWRSLVESHDHVQKIGRAEPGALPWAIIPIDAADPNERAFTTEPFCSVISETALGGAEPVAFLDEAVRFVNERVWGTLSATIIVHPTSLKDPRVAAAVERAIGALRYGTVAINQWPALAYVYGTMPWGGHPSSTLADIQSGRGWVHNTHMLERIDKGVLRGPLVARPKPLWAPGHKTAHKIGRKLVELEAAPSLAKIPSLLFDALRG